MSGDKLPPLPPGGKWEKFGGLWRATRWTGSGLNAYVGATPVERAESAWHAWELDSGQTRAEYEQRERALGGMREIAALMDGYDGEELMELMFGVRRIVELVIGGRRASAEGGD